MPSLVRRIFFLAIVFSPVTAARAWDYRRPDTHAMHMHDIHMAPIYACALIDRFKPNLSDHMVEVKIPTSPYGPLVVSMGWERVIRVKVDTSRYPKQPSEATFEKMRHWVVSHLDMNPPLCTLVLSQPEYASMRIEIAGCTRLLNDAEYVVEHLRLAQLAAAKGAHDMASKWEGSAFAQYSAMPTEERSRMRQDARLRNAAYRLVDPLPPAGLSALGRRSYCDMYRRIASMFPPRSRDERLELGRARSALRCGR